MGCWNQTCALTQLPINSGERVRCFIIYENPIRDGLLGSGGCYPCDFYNHLYVSFTGEYNDYGGVENIDEDFNTKLIYKYLMNPTNCIIKDDDEVIKKDEIENFTQLINDHIERGHVFICNPHFAKNGNKRVYLMMMHEELFNSVTEYYSKSWEDHMLKRHVEDLPDGWGMKNPIDDGFNSIRGLASVMHHHYGDYSEDTGLDDILFERNGTSTKEEKEYLAKAIMNHFKFMNFMRDTRKSFCPQVGQGSQNNEFAPYKHLFKASREYMKKRIAWVKKECGE